MHSPGSEVGPVLGSEFQSSTPISMFSESFGIVECLEARRAFRINAMPKQGIMLPYTS